MSQIKIAPPQAGSGTVTLTAPATNSNRSQSLPDASGTVALIEQVPGPGQAYTAPARGYGTNYTNNTGKLMFVSFEGLNGTNSAFGIATATVNGVTAATARSVANQSSAVLFFVVPPGQSYNITNGGTALNIVTWREFT